MIRFVSSDGIYASKRVPLFGFQLDAIDLDEAVRQIYQWVATRTRQCRFVVTPNVDHAVLFQDNAALRSAYANASLVLADGMPVVAAARILGHALPGRVAGSDLAPALFEGAEQRGGLRLFLLGAAPGVAERAAENIHRRWPNVEVVGTYSPPLGFEKNQHENEIILGAIAAVRPDVLIVGFGAPKQELWVNAHREQIEAAVTLCAGATIDFLAGDKKRAPLWMQRGGLEWLHRVASEPRRLFKRYARDAWIFPRLVWHEWQASRRPALRRPPHPG